MKNLAGDKDCDKTIKEELYLAGIETIPMKSEGEVPYTIAGRIGNWKLRRAWYYWVATVEYPIDGLPLKQALELHNKPNPIDSKYNLGEVIRSGGHCGCPSPDEFGAQSIYDAELNKKFYVNCYHIDDQVGLNEFAKAIKTYYTARAE